MNRYANKNFKNKQRQKKNYLLFIVCSVIVLFCLLLEIFMTNLSENRSLQDNAHSTPSEALDTPGSSSPREVSSPDVSASGTNNMQDVSISQSNPVPEDKFANYDFTMPVPVSTAVDLSYFDDAVFIGDSRTEGFLLNMNLSQAIAYTHKGLMVNTVFTQEVIDINGTKLSIMDALKETEFSKVYIMLGINELGWTYSSKFIDKYSEVIDEIKEINPDAVIYIQSILPVSEEVSATHAYVKNDKIKEYNALIFQMAAEKEVFFLDTAAAVMDENGCLPADAATDGIHLKKKYCELWLQYLVTHTVTGSN